MADGDTELRALERGRQSFAQKAWLDAYEQLSAADDVRRLGLDDVEKLATSAYLTGRSETCADLWARAHGESLELGEVARAVRCAFWLAFGLINNGEMARASGWLARAQTLIDDTGLDCAERGYLLVPMGLGLFGEGDHAGALDKFAEAFAIGKRFGDIDLMAVGCLGRGHALIVQGHRIDGLALLDEAIVAVTSGEVSPMVVGLVYCGAIEVCQEIFDLLRAKEWTAALSHWCDSQPDLVPYRGQCLVHRAEIMQLRGAWRDAADDLQRAGERLSDQPAVGAVFYQQAELHRLRGNFAAAEVAYRKASQLGREPQPGLALLRLAQGQTDVALAAIRRLVDETEGMFARSRILGPRVEIELAAGGVASARRAADELGEIAETLDIAFVHAIAAHATGEVLLAEGKARAALPILRRAWAAWRDLDAPYEGARVRVLIGLACADLGDRDTAAMEFDAARLGFQHLGAATELAKVEALAGKKPPSPRNLTAREAEVLALVAKGKTNREISALLVISEHTVARHVQNIFAKIGVSSRTAAGAFAFEQGLV